MVSCPALGLHARNIRQPSQPHDCIALLHCGVCLKSFMLLSYGELDAEWSVWGELVINLVARGLLPRSLKRGILVAGAT